MSTTTDVALMILQLVALTIPPVVVLIQFLKSADNLGWGYRKLSFALVFSSVILLIAGAITVMSYFVAALTLPITIYAALAFVIAGLVPLCVFVGVLYREHRKAFGP